MASGKTTMSMMLMRMSAEDECTAAMVAAPACSHLRESGTCPPVHVSGGNFGDAAAQEAEFTDEHRTAAIKIQARAKGKKQRQMTRALKEQGALPGQQRREAEELEDYDFEKEVVILFIFSPSVFCSACAVLT